MPISMLVPRFIGLYACFYALCHAHMSRPMCLCLCLHVYMLRSLSSHVYEFGFFFTCLDLLPYMLICLDLHVFMPYTVFSCLDLSFSCIVV